MRSVSGDAGSTGPGSAEDGCCTGEIDPGSGDP